jgi:hypothetical protein
MIKYPITQEVRDQIDDFLAKEFHLDLTWIEGGGSDAVYVVCQLVLNYQARTT